MKEKIARDCHYSSSLHLEASLSSLRLYRTDFLLNFCPYLRQLVFIMCQVEYKTLGIVKVLLAVEPRRILLKSIRYYRVSL